jgi:hypothetical protein
MFQQTQNPQQTKSKMFKILCPIEKKGGGTYWTRCGTAYENKDESINCYLDFFPKDWKFQIRALDAEDLRRMSERSANAGGGASSRSDAWRSATAPYARSPYGSSNSPTPDDDDGIPSAALGPSPSSRTSLGDTPPF